MFRAGSSSNVMGLGVRLFVCSLVARVGRDIRLLPMQPAVGLEHIEEEPLLPIIARTHLRDAFTGGVLG